MSVALCSKTESRCSKRPNRSVNSDTLRQGAAQCRWKPCTVRPPTSTADFAGIVLDQIAKKEAKPYPQNTTLIVQCTLSLPYMPEDWDDLIGHVRQELPASQFREVYLYDPTGRYSYRIFPKTKATDGAGPV
jgi:hypothetical protein